MQYSLLILFSLLNGMVLAQGSSQQIINSAGNTIKGENHILEFSMGEIGITTFNSCNYILTQGILQPPAVLVITSTKELMLPAISVYPNPVTDYVKVESTVPIKEVVISSVSGLYFVKKNRDNTVDLKDLPSGVYVLDFKDENNSTVNLFKITKL